MNYTGIALNLIKISCRYQLSIILMFMQLNFASTYIRAVNFLPCSGIVRNKLLSCIKIAASKGLDYGCTEAMVRNMSVMVCYQSCIGLTGLKVCSDRLFDSEFCPRFKFANKIS